MQYEARFWVAVVRYTSVRSGFWGPVWRTDGESTGTNGGSESGYADRSRGFFAADLTFHDPCSVPSSLVTRILDTKSVGDPLVGQHQPACGYTVRVSLQQHRDAAPCAEPAGVAETPEFGPPSAVQCSTDAVDRVGAQVPCPSGRGWPGAGDGTRPEAPGRVRPGAGASEWRNWCRVQPFSCGSITACLLEQVLGAEVRSAT